MNKKLKKNLLSVLALIFMGNLIALFIDSSFITSPRLWLMNCLFSIGLGFPMMKLNGLILRKVGNKIRWDINPGKRIAATLGVIMVLSVLLTFLINYIFLMNIQGVSPAEYMKTTLNLLLIQALIIIYAFSLVTAIEFFKMWKEGLIRQESMQRKALELQLEALKNQVNPHFLFNSLNTLTTLVHKDPDMAVNLIMQLSDSYRYVLEQRNKKVVKWTVEKQFVENYLGLQKMRFGNNIHVSIDTETGGDFYVIPLSVQMLVENAIKHNVIASDAPLQIDIFVEDDLLVVRNNLQVKTTVTASGNVGLENIRQQYELITGQKVKVNKTDTFFTVILPVIHQPLSENENTDH